MSSTKERTPLRAAGETPFTSAERLSASHRERPFRPANSSIKSSEFLPKPRAGTLTMRRRLTESLVFTTVRK